MRRLNTEGLRMLSDTLSGMQARRDSTRQSEERAQQAYLASLLNGQPYERQRAILAANKIGNVNAPEFEPTPDEQFNALVTKDALSRFPRMSPESLNAGTFQKAYGAQQPEKITVTDINRQNLPAQEFADTLRVGGGLKMDAGESAEEARLAPLTAAQTDKEVAGAAYIRGPQSFQATSAGKSSLANAAESYAGANLKRTQTPVSNSVTATAGGDLDDLVKKIANYEMDISKVTSLRGGERERIAQLVAKYDPTFDMTQYASRATTRKDFTSGNAAKNIRSLNTAVHHLASLQAAADELDNSSIPLWNTVTNYAIKQKGDARLGKFKTNADAVAGEMASVFKGSGATDQEIKAWREQVDSSQSPDQIRGAIESMVTLMGGRLAALDNQWQANMGKPRDFEILSSESRQILERLGINVGGLDSVGGTSQGESAADAYLRKHGVK